jgi:hypothetical protein
MAISVNHFRVGADRGVPVGSDAGVAVGVGVPSTAVDVGGRPLGVS